MYCTATHTALHDVLQAVAHCHASSVVHRDIKPENFLLLNSSEPAALQLADFGLSAFVSEGQRLSDVVGSDYYMAPEVGAGADDATQHLH